MTRKQVRTHASGRALFLGAMLLILGVVPALAQESFRATHLARLDGASEVPSNESLASGIAILKLDTVAKTLEYRISVSDLANITAAHFHFARPDTTGPVLHTIVLGPDFATSHTVTGVWNNVDSNVIRRLNKGGTIYINFHTTAFPGGEIRGHVEFIPNLVASLDAAQEVPPVRVPSNGYGNALLLLDPVARRLDYLITWFDLTGPARNAHFHRGAKGVSGGVAAPIMIGGIPGRAAGTWSNISQEDITLLRNGGIYINIHTDSNSAGEIRGQVFPIEVFTAAISPQNEVVKPTNSQSAGTGFLGFISEIETVSDLFGEFVVDGTTGPITGAHIHVGPVGVAGGIIRTLEPFDPATGTSWAIPFIDGFIDSDSLGIFRASNTYVNFHTAQWTGGELRGQMIPSANNLAAPVSAVAVEQEVTSGGGLRASVERGGGAISFRVAADLRGVSRSITLYSSLGTRIVEIPVDGDVARMTSNDLSSGLYFAQLVVDGRPAGVCRVMITR